MKWLMGLIRGILTMLRKAVRSNPGRRPTTKGASFPAPVGGWNAIDPISAMPVTDAVQMENWIPRGSYVELRRGFRLWSLPAGAAKLESLLVYRGAPSGADKLFAGCNDPGSEVIYDCTTFGSTPSTPAYPSSGALGIGGGRIQYVNFANDGGAWIICVNGVSTPFKYNGSAWSTTTITGSSGSITLTATNLIDVMAHKRRLFFIEKETLRVWFLAVNAITGASQLLDLGPVFQMGGQLLCMGTWSLDGGQGQDDVAVFMTDQGEVAVYQGTDPANPDEWALVGVFSIGVPLGRRCLMKYGGDLYALTTNGVLPLSQALSRDRAQDETVAITAKIQNAFSALAIANQSQFGWEGITYPKGTLAIYNVPQSTGSNSNCTQYVQNIQTGAWCSFTGLAQAICWALKDDDIFFASEIGGVYQWDIGSTDYLNVPFVEPSFQASLKTAYNYFSDRGSQKKFNMLRPTFNVTPAIHPDSYVLVDYKDRNPVPTLTPDVLDPVLTAGVVRDQWQGATGVGYCASVHIRVSFKQPDGNTNPIASTCQLLATNLQYQKGGPL